MARFDQGCIWNQPEYFRYWRSWGGGFVDFLSPANGRVWLDSVSRWDYPGVSQRWSIFKADQSLEFFGGVWSDRRWL